jgi:Fic family protein
MEAGIRQVVAAPVGLWLIRGLHSVLMDGVRGNDEQPGEFRSTQNFIGTPGSSIVNARFVPPPPGELTAVLADFETFLHVPGTAMPLLARIAVAHYQFEAIHPFRDGNGRVGRLLIVLHLIARKRIPGALLNFSAWLDRKNDAYRDLLLAVSREGNFTEWVRFVLEGMAATATDGVVQVERLLTLREWWQARFQSARSSALLMKLVDALFQPPSITTGRAAKLLKVTHATAASNLRKLEREGFVLEATGGKRNQVFVAPEILRFLGEGTGKKGKS